MDDSRTNRWRSATTGQALGQARQAGLGAFTLLELLVVIGIIALLTSITPVSYTHLTLPTKA